MDHTTLSRQFVIDQLRFIADRLDLDSSFDTEKELYELLYSLVDNKTLCRAKFRHIVCVMEKCQGNQSRAALILGISRYTVMRLMREMGIK